MDEKISRREFIRGANLKNLLINWIEKRASDEDRKRESMQDYFRSPMYSYPLLQEMPWEMLVEEAQKHNIPTENRTKNEIAKDLFMLS